MFYSPSLEGLRVARKMGKSARHTNAHDKIAEGTEGEV